MARPYLKVTKWDNGYTVKMLREEALFEEYRAISEDNIQEVQSKLAEWLSDFMVPPLEKALQHAKQWAERQAEHAVKERAEEKRENR